MNDKQEKRTQRERAYQEIEIQDALKHLESEGMVVRVIRPDGQVGYMLTSHHKGRESDTG